MYLEFVFWGFMYSPSLFLCGCYLVFMLELCSPFYLLGVLLCGTMRLKYDILRSVANHMKLMVAYIPKHSKRFFLLCSTFYACPILYLYFESLNFSYNLFVLFLYLNFILHIIYVIDWSSTLLCLLSPMKFFSFSYDLCHLKNSV